MILAARQLRFALAAAAGLGICWLLWYGVATLSAEPCMGVADILDFSRVTIPAGLEHTSPLEAPGYYARCDFLTSPSHFAAAP